MPIPTNGDRVTYGKANAGRPAFFNMEPAQR